MAEWNKLGGYFQVMTYEERLKFLHESGIFNFIVSNQKSTPQANQKDTKKDDRS